MPVLAVLVSFAILGVVALVVAGRAGPGLADAPADGVDLALPQGRALSGGDVRRVGFAMALRGYRMAEVDAVLDRLADEIADRDALIADLSAPADAADGAAHRHDGPRAVEHPDSGAEPPGAAYAETEDRA